VLNPSISRKETNSCYSHPGQDLLHPFAGIIGVFSARTGLIGLDLAFLMSFSAQDLIGNHSTNPRYFQCQERQKGFQADFTFLTPVDASGHVFPRLAPSNG